MTDKERLENMSPVGVDIEGNVLISGVDWHWLGEQAERAQELEGRWVKEKHHKLTYQNIALRYQKEKNNYREAVQKAISHFNYDEHQQGMAELLKALEESE